MFHVRPEFGTWVDIKDLKGLFMSVGEQTRLHQLQAAIARAQLVVSGAKDTGRSERGGAVNLVKDREGGIRKIVFHVYQRCKVGNREPTESFLRCHETQHELKNQGREPAFGLEDPLKSVRHDSVIVYGDQRGMKPGGPYFCLFSIKDISHLHKRNLVERLTVVKAAQSAYFTIREGRSLREVANMQRNLDRLTVK